jgi:hypothetical protein
VLVQFRDLAMSGTSAHEIKLHFLRHVVRAAGAQVSEQVAPYWRRLSPFSNLA